MFPIPLYSNFRYYISPSSITNIFRLVSTTTKLWLLIYLEIGTIEDQINANYSFSPILEVPQIFFFNLVKGSMKYMRKEKIKMNLGPNTRESALAYLME